MNSPFVSHVSDLRTGQHSPLGADAPGALSWPLASGPGATPGWAGLRLVVARREYHAGQAPIFGTP